MATIDKIPHDLELDEIMISIVSKKIPEIQTTSDLMRHAITVDYYLINEILKQNHILIADKEYNIIKELKVFS